MGYAVGYGGVDGQLGEIAQHAEVVVFGGILGQLALKLPHLVGGLEQAGIVFPYPAHRLRIGGVHTDYAQIVQHILGGHRFGADAAFGKGHILRHPGA